MARLDPNIVPERSQDFRPAPGIMRPRTAIDVYYGKSWFPYASRYPWQQGMTSVAIDNLPPLPGYPFPICREFKNQQNAFADFFNDPMLIEQLGERRMTNDENAPMWSDRFTQICSCSRALSLWTRHKSGELGARDAAGLCLLADFIRVCNYRMRWNAATIIRAIAWNPENRFGMLWLTDYPWRTEAN